MTAPYPLCLTCRHVLPGEKTAYPPQYHCAASTTWPDPVTGSITRTRSETAYLSRTRGACGWVGRLHEPREAESGRTMGGILPARA